MKNKEILALEGDFFKVIKKSPLKIENGEMSAEKFIEKMNKMLGK